ISRPATARKPVMVSCSIDRGLTESFIRKHRLRSSPPGCQDGKLLSTEVQPGDSFSGFGNLPPAHRRQIVAGLLSKRRATFFTLRYCSRGMEVFVLVFIGLPATD